ncbi:MAG: hypothetical protein HONBIEJF_00987 [Fimbriimonadaceae bacterium]|nr:hypothetical protein [Fimbriimonadaceae bacterium]
MSGKVSRRTLLGMVPGIAVGRALPSFMVDQSTSKSIYDEFPAQDPKMVQSMVGVSHFDLAKVKELVGKSKEFANAAWDWGFGDWETALGAASHTGQRDIANFLIDNGARPDIFTFAMLGHVAVVKSMIEAQPGLQRKLGPHGIPLLSHAQAGEGQAKAVVEYLESLGDADQRRTSLDISETEKSSFLGEYRFGPGSNDVMIVTQNKNGMMQLQRAEGGRLNIRRVGPDVFAPAGSDSIRIQFKMEGGKAISLTIHDPAPVVIAIRK